MDIITVGLSLRSVSLPALEALSDGARLARAEERMRALPGVRETVRLVTCHRALLLLGVSLPLRNASSSSSGAGSTTAASHRRGGPAHTLSDSLRRILTEEAGIAQTREADCVGILDGADAFRHLVRLACGLESPIEGETEILGQLRAAYAAAVERGAAGRITGGAMHRVFRAARRIRARAGLTSASLSWGEFLAETIVSATEITGRDSLRILGSGSLAQALTTSLRARGIDPTSSGTRVLVTVSGRGRILRAEDLPLANADSGVLEIWDLGMPRNVDPAVASLPGVRLRTLADIPAIAAASAVHGEVCRAAAAMVEEEVEQWIAWRQERGAAQSLVRLGRLLEISSGASGDGPEHDAQGDATRPDFRRDLLRAFSAIAQEAHDEDEASAHLALFEEALRRATRSAPAREARPRTDGPRSPEDRRPSRAGKVSLVGAGPGAGGLLTIEGARRLADADVVYHDALASEEVLAHCRPGARLVSVGKRRGRASASQSDIEAALVRDAQAGLAVVRLKGGDPFVFGRGGEEGLALRAAGVAFDVVPGVSSGIAAPALAGIPLTHRGIASSAAFITAHDLGEGSEGPERRERLAHLARGAETLVIFMAGAQLGGVRRTLQDAGLDPRTPAALIESGATARQRVAIGVLEQLETLGEGLRGGPALVVIGRTVALSGSLGREDQWTADVVDAVASVAPAPERTVTEVRPQRPRGDRRRAG